MITREQVEPRQYAWHPAASKLEWLVIEEAEKLIFDVIMATWWQSAFLLHKFTATHTVYFVQSIESRFFAPENPADHDTRDNGIWKQLCESTYSYAVPMITEARWIKKYLYEKFNVDARLVPNGIRKDIYKTNGKVEASRQNSRLRVLVEGPVDVFYKNVPKAIELCRRAGVDDVWLMTSSEISAYPGADRVFSCIPLNVPPKSIAPVIFSSSSVMWRECSARPLKCFTAEVRPSSMMSPATMNISATGKTAMS